MKRIATALIAVAALAVTLTGCGEVDGTVTSKDYKPAYDTTTVVLVGKVMVPTIIHHDACWQVTVTGDHSGKKCVDKTTYKALSVGERYTGAKS